MISRAFAKRCQVNEKSNSVQTESVNSTVSMGEELFPFRVGLVGDDFMRNFLSFELYGADFTDQNGERKKQFVCFQTSKWPSDLPNLIIKCYIL